VIVPNNDNFLELPVSKRRRGVILSSPGWQRLQAAEYLAAVRDNGGHPYTLEQLSDRTGLSTKTLTKVRRRQTSVDQPTLASYFAAFGLSLEEDDYLKQELDSNIATAVLTQLLQTPLKGQLSPDSPFYIYRHPAEKLFLAEIVQPGALIRIRAPRQFGKTSLIAEHNPELEKIMQQVVKCSAGVELHPMQSFHLQGMGLIRFEEQRAVCSCELYQKYLAQVWSF
jgi:transcriptional regulator with XRE-family HTH domain